MKLKKTMLVVLCCVLAVGLLAACGTTSPNQPAQPPSTPPTQTPTDSTPVDEGPLAGIENEAAVTLRWAEVNPEDSLMGNTANAFKDAIEELSKGSVKVEVYASAVLGKDESTVMETMTSGSSTIDMARISLMTLENYDQIKLGRLASVPFIFTGREHFWRVAESDVGKEIMDEPNKVGLGIRGVCFVEEGFRHFFTKRELTGIESMSGLKLRVSTSPTYVGIVEGVGASATVVAFGELYSALDTGVCDGAEQPIVNYYANKFHEVAPYMILDSHTLGAGMILITNASWDKLGEKQKLAFEMAAQTASQYNRNASEQAENDAIAALTAEGANFVQVPNLQPWRDACAGIIGEITAGMESYVAKIAALE